MQYIVTNVVLPSLKIDMLFIAITISLTLLKVLYDKRNTIYEHTKQPAVFIRKTHTLAYIKLARSVREHHKKNV